MMPRPVSEYAMVFTVLDFAREIYYGGLLPGIDGVGYWVVNGLEIAPTSAPRPEGATHVAWYEN